MRLIKILCFLLPALLVTNFMTNDMKKSTVLVCYGKMKPELIKGYHYVILEATQYTEKDVKIFQSQNDKIFAYISLGEVNQYATHYKELKKNTIGKNAIWNSYYLDLKSPKTITVLMAIVDEMFTKGYDGLFLDNIDNFTIHGPQKEQKEELVQLLKKIRQKYPNKQFIQNAGLDLVAETAASINAIAIESVATDYNFTNKKYGLRDQNHFESQMNRLKLVNETYKIPVLLIEYSDSEQLSEQVMDRIAASEFEYFIGNIDLQHVPTFKK